MTSLAAVLNSVRGKRQAKFQSTTERYDKVLTTLAAGDEVDVDEIAELLDALDKSDSDLQRDVESKSRRLQAADNLKRLRKVQAGIPALEAKLKRLDDELTEIINAKKPAIAEAADKLRTAEAEAAFISTEEHTLRTIGVPLHIQARQQRLQAMIAELRPKRERYENYTAAERHRLPIARRKLEDAEADLARSGVDEPGNRRNAQSRIDSLRREILQHERVLQNFEPLATEITKLQAAIDAERQAIETELMNP
jgi:hypothetical protein